MTVERLDAASFARHLPALAGLLVDAVADGASVGFLSGFDQEAALRWWRSRAAAVAGGGLAVWVALSEGRVTGTVSLAYAEKPNAAHRAEVIKLAVLRAKRGNGAGRLLLATAEREAVASGVTLLLLDTETGSAAEALYRRAGWQRYGLVPAYAADPAGVLRDCSFYFKELT